MAPVAIIMGVTIMLSFIYGLVRTYRREHGFTPNVLYLNPAHFDSLKASLPNLPTETEIGQALGLAIMIERNCLHPHVAWLALRRCANDGH
jgi:hypothetical protein